MNKLLLIAILICGIGHAQTTVWEDQGVRLNYHISGQERLSVTVSNTNYLLRGDDFIQSTVMYGVPDSRRSFDYNGRILFGGNNINNRNPPLSSREIYLIPGTDLSASNIIIREGGGNYPYVISHIASPSINDVVTLNRRPGANFSYNFFYKDTAIPSRTTLGESMEHKSDFVGSAVTLENCSDQIGRYSSIVVSETGTISDVNVHLDINHTYNGDLRVVLRSPTNRYIILTNYDGGGFNNFDVVFDQDAEAVFTANSDNTRGTFRPDFNDDLLLTNQNTCLRELVGRQIYANLDAALVGQNPSGEWRLYVLDRANGDFGIINYWGLTIETE